jgi:hypothetical protein
MKRSLLAIALVSGFMFMVASAFANPALLKKHDGYPTDGKGTTATGAAAEMKSAENAPKVLRGQNDGSGTTDADRAGNVMGADPRQRTHPGYPKAGVVENHIKDATKVNANPK